MKFLINILIKYELQLTIFAFVVEYFRKCKGIAETNV